MRPFFFVCLYVMSNGQWFACGVGGLRRSANEICKQSSVLTPDLCKLRTLYTQWIPSTFHYRLRWGVMFIFYEVWLLHITDTANIKYYRFWYIYKFVWVYHLQGTYIKISDTFFVSWNLQLNEDDHKIILLVLYKTLFLIYR